MNDKAQQFLARHNQWFFCDSAKIGLCIAIFTPCAIQTNTDWRLGYIDASGIFCLFALYVLPITALIFLTTRKTFAWTAFLALFTAAGGFIGFGLWVRHGLLFDLGPPVIYISLTAFTFWLFAVYAKRVQNLGKGKKAE